MVSDANRWTGRGRVAQDIKRGKTRSGDEVCSFQVTTVSSGGRNTWVRVNCYDKDVVKYARSFVKQGRMVHVEGELMNRNKLGTGPQLTEVRAFSVNIIQGEHK